MLSAQCELMEAQALRGMEFKAIAYGQLTGHLTRTLNALGLKREPIDVTPALHQYLDTLGAPAEPSDVDAAARTRGPSTSRQPTSESLNHVSVDVVEEPSA